jgi:type 1 glutamine amidotransferase
VSVRGNRQIAGSAASILGWRTGIAGDAFGTLTFSEAAAKVDAAGSGFIEGFSTQKVSTDIPKNLDYNLTPEDVARVKHRLAELRMRMAAYHAGGVPGDAASRRKAIDFAKELGVETLIFSGPADAASLAELDKLATDASINVALDKVTAAALEGRSNRIGVHVDAAEQVPVFKDRVIAVTLRNTSAPALSQMLTALGQLQPPATVPWPPTCGDCAAPVAPVKPLFIAIAASGGEAAVRQSIDTVAKALKPLEGARIVQISKNTPITSTDGVPPLDRLMIQATVQRLTAVAPKKPRKLLVIDLCPQGGFYHRTIAHANLWLEMVAKTTGAFAPTFSNDLDNLKYPKIKEYDAIFLNSVVGPVFADPEVITGLTRFVREGGGVAGIHGSTYASQDVPEYGEMMGATSGPHRVESKVLKVDDPASPLTKHFEGRDIVHVDEHYHFPPTTPYTREKLHILLSVNTEKSDMTEWKTIRPDGDYGMAWIRAYGQGRVFTTPLGHTPLLLATPQLAQMVLAGTQFALGDLDADTTPSAKLAGKK